MGIDKISGKEKLKICYMTLPVLYHSDITITKNETKYSKTIIKKIDKILFDYSESDDDFVQIILPTTVQVP